jgi:hypothetical protein
MEPTESLAPQADNAVAPTAAKRLRGYNIEDPESLSFLRSLIETANNFGPPCPRLTAMIEHIDEFLANPGARADRMMRAVIRACFTYIFGLDGSESWR